MSYSCTDFVDSILDAMKIELEPDQYDDPAAQADLALEHYNNLVAQRDAMVAVLREVIHSLETLGADGWSDAPHLLRICKGAIKLAESN